MEYILCIILYIYSNTSNLSNFIMDNTYLTSNPLKTSVDSFQSAHILLVQIYLVCQTQFTFCYLRSKRHLGSPKLVSYTLSKNAEDRSEQSSASAYVLHLYKSYRLYILGSELGDSVGRKPPEGSEVYYCYHQKMNASFS